VIFTTKIFDTSSWADVEKLFATDRECNLCFCMNHRVKQEDEVLGAEAQKALYNLTEEKKVCSVLAYDGDKCVGWCAVDPLVAQPGHDYSYWKTSKKEKLDEGTWSIHCLFIHPDYRDKGVSSLLINKAVTTARDKGAKKLIAYPIPVKMRDKFPPISSEFSGRFSTYEKAGFKPVDRINDFYEVVSLDL
jgi:GNAT superfamily N-acetyltransferase